LLGFLSGLAFEISRKIKAPEDEIATIQSYSQIWGAKRAACVALGTLFIGSLLMGLVLNTLQVHLGFYVGILLLFITCAWLFSQFISKPGRAAAKKLELGSSLFMLTAYLLIIIATLTQTGVLWSPN
jgi:4-hydroxybenzoate polyprenyltransferase